MDGQLTNSALILFGTHAALGRFLPQAEVTFEYRSSDASGPAQARKDYRVGFFSYYDDLWNTINLRNDLQHYQDGLFIVDIPTFSERPIREAILNAVSHRDYQLGRTSSSASTHAASRSPVQVAFPSRSPWKTSSTGNHREPRLADIFLKCGLVERSGQGMNLIFEEAIRESKPLPDFTNTDRYQVSITLHGTVQDPEFPPIPGKGRNEQLASFSTDDWMILGYVARGEKVPEPYRPPSIGFSISGSLSGRDGES